MKLNLQDIVDTVFERKALDRFKPVTQYEYKQREGRHMVDTAQLTDEVIKLRTALEKADIEIEDSATDEEIITSILTEEQNFNHQMEVNHYNERVTRYKEGSLIERARIMFSGAPEKPLSNPTVEEDFYEESGHFSENSPKPISKEDEKEEIKELLGNINAKDIERIRKNGDTEEAMKLADELKEQLAKAD